jgi:hypothetical protein
MAVFAFNFAAFCVRFSLKGLDVYQWTLGLKM